MFEHAASDTAIRTVSLAPPMTYCQREVLGRLETDLMAAMEAIRFNAGEMTDGR